MDKASADCPAAPLDSETPLFILYTSGSTGKPKGIMHTTAGYNLFCQENDRMGVRHRDEDVYWCTADLRLGHRPFLRGLWPALGRRDGAACTKARRIGPTKAASGD